MYPRGRRRGGEAAAARNKGKKTLVFSLFFSAAARASDFVKALVQSFFGGKVWSHFPPQF
jgi:hypothetical protein